MVIDMNESKLETIAQIREFLTGTADVTFSIPADESTLRAFVATVIRRFSYFSRSKGQRGVLTAYLRRLTGYSRQHLSRLLAQYRDTRSLKPRVRASRTSEPYRKRRLLWRGTRPSPVAIGVRKAPAPQGLPGYIRIDTVHGRSGVCTRGQPDQQHSGTDRPDRPDRSFRRPAPGRGRGICSGQLGSCPGRAARRRSPRSGAGPARAAFRAGATFRAISDRKSEAIGKSIRRAPLNWRADACPINLSWLQKCA